MLGPAGGARRTRTIGLCLGILLVVGLAVAASASASGNVVAWGGNGSGELGNGSTTPGKVPVAVSLTPTGGETVSQVSAGSTQSLALLSGGSVLAWGSNSYGELGDGGSSGPESCFGEPCSTKPASVNFPVGARVLQVSAGEYEGLAVMSQDTVMAWGLNEVGQLGDGNSTGPDTCAGGNPCGTTPELVCAEKAAVFPCSVAHGDVLENAIQVSAAADHSVALLAGNKVVAWGQNELGELGNGGTTNSDVPVAVSIPSGDTVTEVKAGNFYTLARLSTGAVLAWGVNNRGELGDGGSAGPEKCFGTACSETPRLVNLPSGTTVTEIAAGYRSALALTTGGTVLGWGENASGNLGDGTSSGPETCGTEACSRNPVAVCEENKSSCTPTSEELTGVAEISAGNGYGIARLTNKTGVAWGYNGNFGLGDGAQTNTDSPIPVSSLSNTHAISAGGHSLALLSGTPSAACSTITTSPNPSIISSSNPNFLSFAVSVTLLEADCKTPVVDDTITTPNGNPNLPALQAITNSHGEATIGWQCSGGYCKAANDELNVTVTDEHGIQLTSGTEYIGSSDTSNNPSVPAETSASKRNGEELLEAKASNGEGSVSVGRYPSNPIGTPPPFEAAGPGAFFDVALTAGTPPFSELKFTVCTIAPPKLAEVKWYNSMTGVWKTVSMETAPSPGASPNPNEECITVTVNSTTEPNLTQMGGTVFAMGSPSAAYGTCKKSAKVAKHYTGKYDDKNCTVKDANSQGKYEWLPTPIGSHISATGKTKTVTLKAGSVSVVCRASASEGEISGPASDTETITYSGCESSGQLCTSAGQAAGVIKTALLKTALVPREDGEVWTSYESATPPYLDEFQCGEVKYRVKGSFAAVAGCNVNVMSKKFCETLSEAVGEQHLELEVVGGSSQPATESTVVTGKSSEKLEIKT